MTRESQRTVAAYAICLIVFSGLMSLIAVGGSAVSSKKTIYFTSPIVTVSK